MAISGKLEQHRLGSKLSNEPVKKSWSASLEDFLSESL